MPRHRSLMTLTGIALGLGLYALDWLIETQGLPARLAFALVVFVLTFALGLMILTGPLGIKRATVSATALAAPLSLLLSWAGLRFDTPTDLLSSPPALAALVTLATLPWPFLIARAAPEGWSDYATLFRESWSIVARSLLALMFTGLLWLTIFLSDQILQLADLRLIADLLDWPPAPWAITGAALGLGTAVVDEIAPALSPRLLLRLLRLLLPLVLAVSALFLAILPFRGLTGLFGSFSAATTLLMLTTLAITLVTSAIDEDDDNASPMTRAPRVLAALAVIPAGLAGFALWQRVAAYGWTPERLSAATATGLLLAYGLAYWAAITRPDWRARIRQANVGLALGQIAIAVLWLSVLNPEAISSRAQLARLQAGQGDAYDLDRLASWGRAGDLARGTLPDVPAQSPDPRPDPRPALTAALPLRPDTPQTRALRDLVLTHLSDDQAQALAQDCQVPLPGGGSGCVLVFADLLPDVPGPEAMLLSHAGEAYSSPLGFSFENGAVADRYFQNDTVLYDPVALAALISRLQSLGSGEGPATAPVPRNQLALPEAEGLTFGP